MSTNILSLMNLLDLPEELLFLCCQHADISATRALRLTCKRMIRIATKGLFAHVHLLPTTASANKARVILENEDLMPLVTTISIRASLENHNSKKRPTWGIPGWPEDNFDYNGAIHGIEIDGLLSPTFKKMLNDIGLFKNLRRVDLKFDWEVKVDGSWDDSGNHKESQEYRDLFLQNFLRALNHPEHPASKVHGLSICNLQDLSDYEILGSEDFKSVLSRLDTLELNIATEERPTGRDQEIAYPERHQFFGADLVDLWLAPVQHNLVSLKLYSNCYWGYLPKCDLRKLHFPRLKRLALGKMTFTHDWQLDWILSHGQTLESLTLYDCPLVHDANVAQGMDSERYVTLHEGTVDWDMDNERTWSYASRWHDYFRKMTTGLPHLQRFGMAHMPWGVDYYETTADGGAFYDCYRSAFETAAALPALLQGGRYFIFEWSYQWVGPGGSHYGVYEDCTEKITELEGQYECGWEVDDEPPLPPYPDCWDRDQEAFDVFMAAVEARRARKQSV
ncbi:hypothetical protein Q7P35_012156 [Cladosporium inversicolor]